MQKSAIRHPTELEKTAVSDHRSIGGCREVTARRFLIFRSQNIRFIFECHPSHIKFPIPKTSSLLHSACVPLSRSCICQTLAYHRWRKNRENPSRPFEFCPFSRCFTTPLLTWWDHLGFIGGISTTSKSSRFILNRKQEIITDIFETV